jgi:hypothetical protein
MKQHESKVWEAPAVQILSIKNLTLGGPAKGQPEGSKPGVGLGGDGGPTSPS